MVFVSISPTVVSFHDVIENPGKFAFGSARWSRAIWSFLVRGKAHNRAADAASLNSNKIPSACYRNELLLFYVIAIWERQGNPSPGTARFPPSTPIFPPFLPLLLHSGWVADNVFLMKLIVCNCDSLILTGYNVPIFIIVK